MSAARPWACSSVSRTSGTFSIELRYLICVLAFLVSVFSRSGGWLPSLRVSPQLTSTKTSCQILWPGNYTTARGLNWDYTTKSPSDDFSNALSLSGRLSDFYQTKSFSRAANPCSSRISSSVPLTLVLSRLGAPDVVLSVVAQIPRVTYVPGLTDSYNLTILILCTPGFEPIAAPLQNHSTPRPYTSPTQLSGQQERFSHLVPRLFRPRWLVCC